MTQTYDIILTVGTESPTNTGLVFKQNDSGQTLRMTVEDFDTTGTTASLIFRKKDNNVVQANIASVGNVYTYVMRGTELEVVGNVVADIKFYDSENNRISSSSFIINVIPDTINPDGVSNSYSDAINESVYRCNQAAKAAEDIVLGAVPMATDTILGGVKSGGDVIVGTDGMMTVPDLVDLQNQINQSNNNLAVKTGTITFESGYSFDSYSVKQTGNIVTVYGLCSKTDLSVFGTTQFKLGTISGVSNSTLNLRTTTGYGNVLQNVGMTSGYGYLGTDGALYFTTGDATAKYVVFQFTYIV